MILEKHCTRGKNSAEAAKRVSPRKNFAKLRSFTLIELLVVIAIITAVAALLAPALRSAREQTKTVKCANNLHQIGIANALYGEDTGYYPNGMGYYPNGIVMIALSPYLGRPRPNTNNNMNCVSPLCWCPSAQKYSASDFNTFHYSAHPYVFNIVPDFGDIPVTGSGDPADDAQPRPYPIRSRTSEIIMMADGNQNSLPFTKASSVYLGCLGGLQEVLREYSETSANDPVNTGDNVDGGFLSTHYSIRFRHNMDTQANVLFVDGHVATFKQGKILQRNVRFDSMTAQ